MVAVTCKRTEKTLRPLLAAVCIRDATGLSVLCLPKHHHLTLFNRLSKECLVCGRLGINIKRALYPPCSAWLWLLPQATIYSGSVIMVFGERIARSVATSVVWAILASQYGASQMTGNFIHTDRLLHMECCIVFIMAHVHILCVHAIYRLSPRLSNLSRYSNTPSQHNDIDTIFRGHNMNNHWPQKIGLDACTPSYPPWRAELQPLALLQSNGNSGPVSMFVTDKEIVPSYQWTPM